MPEPTNLPEWGRLVDELRQLEDETLLQVWRRNTLELDRTGLDHAGLRRRDVLRLQHYACRFVAIERFGAVGHLARRYPAVA